MSVRDLLKKIRINQINLDLTDEGMLQLSSECEEIPSALVEEITANKAIIVEYLRKHTAGPSPRTSIIKLKDQADYALSSAQFRMWMICQHGGRSLAYNVPSGWIIRGPINSVIFRSALAKLVERHEILRTVFKENSFGDIRQWIIPVEKIPIDSIYQFEDDLSELVTKCNAQSVYQQTVNEEFSLSEGPLLRVRLCRLGMDRHILVCAMHHIICDGWSMAIFVKELISVYKAIERNTFDVLPALGIQYKDYAQWEQQQLEGMRLQRSKNYWVKQLEDTSVLNLPLGKPRPPEKTFIGRKIDIPLFSHAADATVIKSGKREATLFMEVLTAVIALLYRYTGQEDIVIGTPVAGRSHADLEDQIGFYVNTVAIRIRFKGTDSLSQLVDNVRKVVVEALDHQDYPFHELVRTLNFKHDASRQVVFDVMVIFENNFINEYGNVMQLPDGLDVSLYEHKGEISSQFDLTYRFYYNEEQLRLSVEYNVDLFEASTITRMAEHIENLLREVLTNSDEQVNKIDFIGSLEKELLLHRFNSNDQTFPDISVVRWFENQVKENPGRVAVIRSRNTLTYEQLNRQANRLSHFLRSKGIGIGSRVAICMERRPELIVSILAILKAGGAYVPVDPEYPIERKQYIFQDTEAEVILAISSVEVPDYTEDKVLFLDKEEDFLDYADTDLCLPLSMLDAAYVIYTSGSTGAPKGVLIEHGAIVNRLQWAQKYFNLTENDTILQKTTFCFDVSVWELLWPVLVGSKFVFADQGGQKDPQYLKSIIEAEKISVIHFAPSMLDAFLAELVTDDKSCRNLSTIICSGEALTVGQVENVKKKIPAATLYNLYGPTEAAIDVTYWKATDLKVNVVPIGRPVANTHIRILDTMNGIMPIGCWGELCIGGRQLARGYINRIELTHEKFIRDPFSSRHDDKLYKTGDYARWLPDGLIEFLGRMDDQVKIRGFRIELGEIENVLGQLKQVKQCVVTAHRDSASDGLLVAYLVAHDGTVDLVELRNELRSKLPDYMVPVHFIVTDQLPVTASGKVNRKALPAFSAKFREDRNLPENFIESNLVRLWSEILEIDDTAISTGDRFIDLGGHSLKAISLTTKVRETFSVHLPLKEIFSRQTVKRLAEFIAHAPKQPIKFLEVAPELEYYPTTSSQKRLFFINKLDESSTAYNMSLVLQLKEIISIDYLEKCLTQLVSNHESLRTSFKLERGVLVQKINLHVPFRISLYRCNSKAAPQVVNDFVKPFDLTNAPLFRVAVVHLDDQPIQLVVIDVHHIITDGTSMMVLEKDLRSLLRGDQIIHPTHTYKDYAWWDKELKSSDLIIRQQQYWSNVFANAVPRLDLVTDCKRPAVFSFKGNHLTFSLDQEELSGIESLNLESGSTLFMTMLAFFNVLFYKYTGQSDIVIGNVTSGRRLSELERMVGMFANTLPMRNSVTGQKTFSAFLQEVIGNALEALENQDVQFEDLIEIINISRDPSRNPIFDVCLTVQNFTTNGLNNQVNPFVSSPFKTNHTTAKFDLSFLVQIKNDQLIVEVEYYNELYTWERVENLCAHLKNIIRYVLLNPNALIGEIDMLSAEEKKKLLANANGPERPHYCENLRDLFQIQAAKTPDAIAVKLDDKFLTYHELNNVSNQLANFLVNEFKIEKGNPVGIFLDRSMEQIVAVLGILIAGGVYVPIEVSQPASRSNTIIADAGLKFIVSQIGQESALVSLGNHIHSVSIDIQSGAKFSHTGLASQPIERPNRKIDSPDLAYVIYTSGSTGRPKGVMIEHGSVINLITDQVSRFRVEPSDRILQFSSLTFDASVEQIFLALSTGAQLILLRSEYLSDPAKIEEVILKNEITHLHATPSFLSTFHPNGIFDRTLKRVVAGGEECALALAQKWSKTAIFFNEYGPTEATITALAYEYKQLNESNSVPIGRPIANSAAYLLDGDGNLVPWGCIGELHLSGTLLARGYLGLDDLSKKIFKGSHLQKKSRLYATGDFARLLPDGQMIFTGRKDDQVKVRGYRIELGEIENAIVQYPGCDACAVILTGKPHQNLIAYISGKQQLDATSIRIYLTTILPSYFIPWHFIQLDNLPFGPTGKIDKTKLREHHIPQPVTNFVAPHTEEEFVLITVCEHVLKRQSISMSDNFFHLGGDSIKSMQIISGLRERGFALSVRDVMQFPELHSMAKTMRRDIRTIVQQEITGVIPLSPIQQSFFRRSIHDFHHYNQSLLIKCNQPVQKEQMHAVLQEIIRHHDALRISFKKTQEGWIQLNRPFLGPYDMEEMFIHSGEEEHEFYNRIQAGFDLNEGPLIKMVWLHTHRGERILIVIHHLVIDGISWRILLEDITRLYQSASVNKKLILPPKTDSFQYWMNNQVEYAKNSNLSEEWKYWNTSQAKVEKLPLDNPGGRNLAGNVVEKSFILSEEQTELFISRCHLAYRTEANDILIACLCRALGKVFRVNNIVVNLEGHGREGIGSITDVSRTIGWFTSLFPVILPTNPGQDIISHLITVKEILHRVPNKGIGYGILKFLKAREMPSLGEITFNNLGDFSLMQKESSENIPFEIASEYCGSPVAPHTVREFTLDVSCFIRDKRLSVGIQYSREQYNDETIGKIIDQYQHNVVTLIETLSSTKEKKLTPVDLTFKGLSVEQLNKLNKKF